MGFMQLVTVTSQREVSGCPADLLVMIMAATYVRQQEASALDSWKQGVCSLLEAQISFIMDKNFRLYNRSRKNAETY